MLATAVVAGSSLTAAVPVSASASPIAALARAGKATLAQLRIGTLGIRTGQAVEFDLAGSRIAAGRHLHSAELSFGDHSSRTLRAVRGTVRHSYQRAGVYEATLVIVDSAGHRSSARRSVVVAAPADNVRLRKTTIKLPASDLRSIVPLGPSSELFTLKPGIKMPRAGQTLLVGRGPLVPDGLIAIVRKAVRKADGATVVRAEDGTLGDAYAGLAVVATGKVGPNIQIAGGTASSASGGPGRMVPAAAVPFTCETSSDHTVNVTADFTNTHISTTINLPGRIFSFNAIVKPVFSLGVQFQGTAECSLADGFGLNIPVPSVPGLVITVGPYLSLSASGTVTASASWNPAFFISLVRAPNDNQQFVQYSASTSASASGSATVELKGGLAVTVSEAKQAGLEIDAGPIFTATASVGTSGDDCISVSSEIELEAKLFAHAFGFVDAEVILYDGHFFHTTLFNKCTPGSSGSSGSGSGSPPQGGGSGGSSGSGQPYLGPTVSETTGGVAQTWTDYAHAGGSRGPDITANRTVGIVCRTNGFKVADGNTWWYLVGSSPWNATFYVSADPFYNNGQTSGELRGTPFVDTRVPECTSQIGGNPSPVTPPTSPPTGSGKTYAETTGGVTRTFTDYTDAGGTQGPSVASNATVQVTCKITGFKVADGNTWWYQIASGPWSDAYYASADAFYNNGQTSGSLNGTPFVDSNVPDCTGPPPPPPPPATFAETTGGVTHTWTDYTDAGGTQGPSIASNQTVQITCRLQGFKVADGNTWWYQIASGPWSNAYYASADAFYNNGATSGPLKGTPFVDPNVTICGSAPGTVPETTGGVTHTWTDYTDAGGTQGPSIASNQTVQIACRLQGFKVADGNTWWYRIASGPWNSTYYASADAFYNNGATSGPLKGTPFVDPNVPFC